jgi:hypothetical protein
MQAKPDETRSFDKKTAEEVARQFNKSFGHALMYGVLHQMTIDSIKPFHTTLQKAFERHPFITFTIERESIFIEGLSVDKFVNAKKLSGHFKKAGIQSFSFEKSLTEGHLGTFSKSSPT